MDEKDKQIQQLFDEYADSLEERPELSQRAREIMERNAEKYASETKKAARQKNRRAVYIGLGSLAAAAVVGVFAIGVLPRILSGGSKGDGNPIDGEPNFGDVVDSPSSYVTSYNISEVRAVSVSSEFAEDYINMDAIKETAEVFADSYYACYLSGSDDPIYVKAVFGVSTEYGVIEMCVIAERDGYRREDLEESYRHLINDSGYYRYNYDRINGEYVTMAYFEANKKNYYVASTASCYGATEIIKNFYYNGTNGK